MEASGRLLGTTAALHRHLRLIPIPSLPLPLANSSPRFSLGSVSLSPSLAFHPPSLSSPRSAVAGPFRSPSPPSSLPLPPFLSLSRLFAAVSSQDRVFSSDSDPKEDFFRWDRDQAVPDGGDLGFCNEKGAIWTVVLLGWLGAEPKHLNKYAALYSSKGIRPVRFLIPVKELVGLDLGRSVQDKIARFTRDLVSWCTETEKDGRERCLLLHTFSNTGWLTYGCILDHLQTRPDIIQKIRGCIIDSGAAPEISAQVWAAGFWAAGFGSSLCKRQSSLVYSSVEGVEVAKLDVKTNGLAIRQNSPSISEILFLSLLEKVFTIILMLPDVNQRLGKTISILTDAQPSCPQLYLYSSSDKIIPVNSVENFIEQQKKSGKIISVNNFGSSPHVDHLRSFPEVYSTKINEFLKLCCSVVV